MIALPNGGRLKGEVGVPVDARFSATEGGVDCPLEIEGDRGRDLSGDCGGDDGDVGDVGDATGACCWSVRDGERCSVSGAECVRIWRRAVGDLSMLRGDSDSTIISRPKARGEDTWIGLPGAVVCVVVRVVVWAVVRVVVLVPGLAGNTTGMKPTRLDDLVVTPGAPEGLELPAIGSCSGSFSRALCFSFVIFENRARIIYPLSVCRAQSRLRKFGGGVTCAMRVIGRF
ncbi:hypothetical protein [Lacisediminimonas sp.]|uniref:hypothetical protein n=1 Tax=Lacisediminimonas sp. TaxID=3060582 RepID=UPI002717C3E5|nr:hypothetical protein [Lacisediminimonas sp.]MDO8300590.1 hypothetical protein [Lacisediminimonas sp.]